MGLREVERRRWDRAARRRSLALAVAAVLLGRAAVGWAEAPPTDRGARLASGLSDFARTLKTNPVGSFYLKLRPRYEYARIEGQRRGNALTLRGVVGFGSRTWKGLSFLAEGEGIASADRDWYFDGARRPNGRSFIPDPPTIGLNQGYLHYEQVDFTTNLRLGRQRIILDDARFVGNVGWRQNEQTFDAAFLSTGVGRRDLRMRYAYLGHVRRVFGDRGRSRTRDFDSESHLVNLLWTGLRAARPTVFAYLLDFDNAPQDSSNTYGVRLAGSLDLAPRWQLDYTLSYAYQSDAGDNPDDYRAHYAWIEGALVQARAGTLAVGFERLGSDDGRAVFRTPLGTIHNFNGWADAFLDNGGPDGLRDLFVRVLPRLPWRLAGAVAAHRFWADDGGRGLGWEFDALVSRPLSRSVTLLAKTAYFESSDRSRPDTFRAWLQLTVDL